MTRTFIQTDEFVRQWKKMNLTDEDLRRLELEILKNPQIGDVIPGTGRLRKLRFSFQYQGKSGSSRICYVDFMVFETIYLITAYPKNVKDNLTKEECNNIKKMINLLEKQLRKENTGNERNI